MTKRELSLLLFLESCAVDLRGRIDVRHMNSEDMETARKWNEIGYVLFGRRKMDDIGTLSTATCWCVLSSQAMADAAVERAARQKRSVLDDVVERAKEKFKTGTGFDYPALEGR